MRGVLLFVVLALAGAVPLRAEMVQVAPGIYRGTPVQSAADYRALRQHGIRTVIDLRNLRRFAIARESRRLSAMGIAYYNVPIRFPLRDNSPERALALAANPGLQPVLVHCNLGNDRAGLVAALYRVRYQGWSKPDAFAEMERLGFHHFLGGLERYFWASPGLSHPASPPAPHLENRGEPIIAARRLRGNRAQLDEIPPTAAGGNQRSAPGLLFLLSAYDSRVTALHVFAHRLGGLSASDR